MSKRDDRRFTGNPVMSTPAADPTLVSFGGKYYMYPTGAGVTEPGFAVWSSDDLTDWQSHGMILKFSRLGWAKKDAWAPDIIERNGKYYFYFSADSSIGVAISDSPTGPFTDPLGCALIPFEEDMSTIDPCVFIDDDGRTYLYWGATFNGRMFMRELNPDMISFKSERKVVFDYSLEKDYHCEGSFMLKRGGLYYYLWSEYIWCDSPSLKVDHSYRVNYAVSDNPEGPFTKELSRVPILSTDAELNFIGPGHNSVLSIPGRDEYYVMYHQHQGNARFRRANIDKLTFSPCGAINTVRMTDCGVPARALDCWLEHTSIGECAEGSDKAFLLCTRLDSECIDSVSLFANGAEVARHQGFASELVWRSPERGFYKVHAVITDKEGNTYHTKALNTDVVAKA